MGTRLVFYRIDSMVDGAILQGVRFILSALYVPLTIHRFFSPSCYTSAMIESHILTIVQKYDNCLKHYSLRVLQQLHTLQIHVLIYQLDVGL